MPSAMDQPLDYPALLLKHLDAVATAAGEGAPVAYAGKLAALEALAAPALEQFPQFQPLLDEAASPERKLAALARLVHAYVEP